MNRITTEPLRVYRSAPVIEQDAPTDDSVTTVPDYADTLQSTIDTHNAAIEDILATAQAAGRDLTEAEQTEADRHRTAVEELAPQVERWLNLRATRSKLTKAHASAPRSTGVKVVERSSSGVAADGADPKQIDRVVRQALPTVGAAAFAVIRQSDPDQAEKLQRVQRALQPIVTADTPGVLPINFVGDLWGRLTAVRPTVDAARKLPLPPDGMQFKRPKITQHSLVSKQAAELDELASRKVTIDSDSVEVQTLAGAVRMSFQEAERTSPSALDIVFQDLAQQFGIATEKELAALIAALTNSTVQVALTASEDDLRAAIYSGAGLVYAGLKQLPNRIWAGMDWWAGLGKLSKPINPQDGTISASPTSLSMSVNGIEATVSPELPAGFLAIGHTDATEWYEPAGQPVQLRAMQVGTGSYELGVYGVCAAKVWDQGVAVLAGGATA